MPFDVRTTPLNAVQARVLATLLEKSRTVPDSYPLSLNSLVAGCNQKSSRDPVMQLHAGQVEQALWALRAHELVEEVGGARVPRWQHHFARAVGVPDQSAVLLALLMLRGPQTAAQLRLHAERWHRFADVSSVEAFLAELQERRDDKGGPLVTVLARAPGVRESRWAHLLCGPVDSAALAASTGALDDEAAIGFDDTALARRVQVLEAEVAALRAAVQRLDARQETATRADGS